MPNLKQAIVDTKTLKEAQSEDATLAGIRQDAKEQKRHKPRGGSHYHYEVNNEVGLLYRIFPKEIGSSNIEIRQIVVPRPYRKYIMALAHEAIVGGHLGTQKTVDRITSNFH